MQKSFRVLATSVSIGLVTAISVAAQTPDYSKEAFVIQEMATKVAFAEDGSRVWRQTVSLRVQSEAAVRQFGVLGFAYRSENETITVDYVRVRKPGGAVVDTPPSSVMDVTADVARIAPTYSDLHQKQIPVKALSTGDVLEYSIHSSQKNIETPGQFWYDQGFVDDSVVLNQTLEISVPQQKQLQVSSPKLKAETQELDGRRIYLWKYAHTEPTKPADQKNASAADEDEPPAVHVTSFQNWQEIGNWWSALASPQNEVTPAIQEKANELTKGLSSGPDKTRALYNYVATRFRYISISLGAGRYRPHTAAEVLSNQYGDCKDKHTLLAALLKAAGVEAWPALIGAGIKFNDKIPSPGQFNHVVTVVPDNGHYVWLDTTTEVAPFGLLSQSIRDEQALLIPNAGKPLLVKTPLNPPFDQEDVVDVTAALDKEGVLTGHFDLRTSADGALTLRSAFRLAAPNQWQALAQQISYGMGFAGDVAQVELENLEETEKPFHYSYNYKRKDYSKWSESQITFPIPAISLGPGAEADKPKQSFWVGATGVYLYKASVKMPPGYTPSIPGDQKLSRDFAEYSAHYLWKDGVFSVERRLRIKTAKISPQQWSDYQNFAKALAADQTTFISLSNSDSAKPAAAVVSGNNQSDSKARQLLDEAAAALRTKDFNRARDLLAQAQTINAKEPRLWALRSFVAMFDGKTEESLADVRKEIEFHPNETIQLAAFLKSLGRDEEALRVLKQALAVQPEDPNVASNVADFLLAAKRYDEIPAALEKAITASPGNYGLRGSRAAALALSGHKEQALAEAREITAKSSNPDVLNNLAYSFAEAGLGLDEARRWAESAVSQTEAGISNASLTNIESNHLIAVHRLGMLWDTLGWIYFKQNDLAGAERYLTASWQLSQSSASADHLADIYEKQQKHAAAVHMWRLALASNGKDAEARRHLDREGSSDRNRTKASMSPAEELGRLRTAKVPALPSQTGTAEFFVLFSTRGVVDAQFISGSDALKDSAAAVKSAHYDFTFPDSGAELLIRRGILSCSIYTTPSCNITLLLPASTVMQQNMTNRSAESSNVTAPTLQTKVDPTYSPAALEAKLEGMVLLSITVTEEGVPEDVSVLKSLGMGLDEKAIECVKKWRFNPGTKDGKPVKVAAKVEVNFRIQPPPEN